MRKLQDTHGLDQLIEAGSSGHFPLFYKSWILESFAQSQNAKKITFSKAAENVHRIFKKIERHTSIERKMTAISAMKADERSEFVLSFMKMVEFRSLDKMKELH
jgi:hypothetical protein